MFHPNDTDRSVHRPPVIKELAIVIAFVRQGIITPHPNAGLAFDPSLQIAIVGIRDDFADWLPSTVNKTIM